jgi:hypothetical protein
MELRFRDEDLPALFRAADRGSLEGQRFFRRGTAAILWGALAAAVCGSIGGPAPAAVAAIAFIVSLVVQVELARRRPEEEWYDGRAVAESVKSLAWQYAVAGGRYGSENFSSGRESDVALTAELRELLSDVGAARLSAADEAGGQITDGMRGLRREPLEVRRDVYLQQRLGDQRGWYARKAKRNRLRRRDWLRVILAAELAGGVGAILAVLSIVNFDLLGVAAAASAAAIAWFQLANHGLLEAAYGLAAQDLSLAHTEGHAIEDESDWAEFVANAEQAISREHRLWRAARGQFLST